VALVPRDGDDRIGSAPASRESGCTTRKERRLKVVAKQKKRVAVADGRLKLKGSGENDWESQAGCARITGQL